MDSKGGVERARSEGVLVHVHGYMVHFSRRLEIKVGGGVKYVKYVKYLKYVRAPRLTTDGR